jgi:hypothetical protein
VVEEAALLVDHFALAPDPTDEAVRPLHVGLSANATHAIFNPTRDVVMDLDLDLVDHLGTTVDIETIVRPGMPLHAELRPHRILGQIAPHADLVSRSRHPHILQPLDYLLGLEVHL